MEGLTEIIFSSGMIRVYLIILMIAAAVYKIYLKFYKKSEKFMKFAFQFPGPRHFPIIGTSYYYGTNTTGGYTLPKGSTAILAFTLLHLDPETFPNPRECNPNNFLPERIAARNPYSYCLFSAGPRNCIAKKYAMLNIKAADISIIRNFWLLPTRMETIYALEVVLRSTTGIHVGLKKRTEERPIV